MTVQAGHRGRPSGWPLPLPGTACAPGSLSDRRQRHHPRCPGLPRNL